MGDGIQVQVEISFLDAAKGVKKDINITPSVQCTTCTGTGLRTGVSRSACSSCEGTGRRMHVMQGGFQMISDCATCGGTGTSIPRGGACGTCKGAGAVRKAKTITVDIPGGVEDGMRLDLENEGNYPPTGQSSNPRARAEKGSLHIFIRVTADTKFARSGSDILYKATIPLTTAILGGEITIPTLDGTHESCSSNRNWNG